MRVPREHDGQHRRRVARSPRLAPALALALALVGCTAPDAGGEALLEAASVGSLEGAIVIGDAFTLLDARLSVAPANEGAEGTPGRAVLLADPPEIARTALLRDHWVLEATLRERVPAAAIGMHRIRLDWNGALAGTVYVEGANASAPLAVVVRFDVGERIASSNVYAFEIARSP